MVVAISPSQTEGFVAALLRPAGIVAGQPVGALGPADDVGSEVSAQLLNEMVRDPEDFQKDPVLVFALPQSLLPCLQPVPIGTQIGVLQIARLVTAAPPPLDGPKGDLIFRTHKGAAVGAEGAALDVGEETIRLKKVGNALHPQGHARVGAGISGQNDSRQESTRMEQGFMPDIRLL